MTVSKHQTLHSSWSCYPRGCRNIANYEAALSANVNSCTPYTIQEWEWESELGTDLLSSMG